MKLIPQKSAAHLLVSKKNPNRFWCSIEEYGQKEIRIFFWITLYL